MGQLVRLALALASSVRHLTNSLLLEFYLISRFSGLLEFFLHHFYYGRRDTGKKAEEEQTFANGNYRHEWMTDSCLISYT